ncbi:MAG: rhomboid family intramembrane serine protease, partial [Chloroflexota bacterium]
AIPYELTRLQDIPPTIDYPVLVTIFTSMFLHGGILHIGANMLFLWIFGDNIEDVMGHGKFLLFYLLCGIAAIAAQVAINPSSEVPIIGASGAISGVMGAYLVLFPGGLVRVAAIIWIIPLIFRLPAVIVIGMWFVIQIFSGFATLDVGSVQSGGTAYFAHIGGFLAGIVLVFVFADRTRRDHQKALRGS